MHHNLLVTLGAAAVLMAVTAGAPDLKAQTAPVKPPRKSFSNKKAGPARSIIQAFRHATQEELVDAVLGDTMNKLWDQADEHFHLGEYNHTIGLNRIVVQGDPHNLEAYANSSWLLWSDGKNEDAEAFLQEGIAANPDTYYMYDEMGIYWLFERRDVKAALPYYEKAVKFDCPALTWNSLANCYEKTEQWQKAVTAWEKATLYPKNAVALVRLKRARARLAQQKTSP